MRDDPTASDSGVFQSFFVLTMAIQSQLSGSYHGDRYLRDRLQNGIIIQYAQKCLRHRPAKTSQGVINRVANKLSSRPKNSGTEYGYWSVEGGEESNVAL